jgi:hypothetical protein
VVGIGAAARRHLALAIALVLALVSLPVGQARAVLVTTEAAIAEAREAGAHDRVVAFLARADVKEQLVALGVDPDEAAARAAGLSDREAVEIASRLDDLPAGEGAVGAILGAAMLVFFVLLVTDLLGLTDVYPFVRK